MKSINQTMDDFLRYSNQQNYNNLHTFILTTILFLLLLFVTIMNKKKTESFNKDGPSMISVNILIRSISKISDLDMVSLS